MSVSHPIEAMCYDDAPPSNEAAADELRKIASMLRSGRWSKNDAAMLLDKLAFCLEKKKATSFAPGPAGIERWSKRAQHEDFREIHGDVEAKGEGGTLFIRPVDHDPVVVTVGARKDRPKSGRT